MGQNNNIDHINHTMSEFSKSIPLATAQDLYTKVKVLDGVAYIIHDDYVANPSLLLGKVIEVRKVNGVCPMSFTDPTGQFEFSAFSISNPPIDEKSTLDNPVIRGSIVVDNKLTTEIGFLSYLKTQLSQNSYFSLMVFDQQVGQINDKNPAWTASLRQWKVDNAEIINDPEVCYIYVVTGFVQKNIVRKQYDKFEGKGQAQGYGININGTLATSTEQYSLDIIFGLSASVLKRPAANVTVPANNGPQIQKAVAASLVAEDPFLPLNEDDMKLFASASGKKFKTNL